MIIKVFGSSKFKLSGTLALAGILCLAIFLRLWMCLNVPYLHEWDERYHALVAKNLLLHPLKPTLYETPLFDYDYREWASNHIWLSKPPLPLWLMAASIKFWGTTEWAVRFPSLLLSLGSVLLTWRIARDLIGPVSALWAAFFHAIHGLILEVAAGRVSSDHVETMFLFWMGMGFLFLSRYFNAPSKRTSFKFSALIGLSTGLAFMCKWTAAFLLPTIWVTLGLLSGRRSIGWIKDIATMMCIFAIITMPWIIYIFQYYPLEASAMINGVFSPIANTVQGHTGNAFFYLDKARIIFGEAIYLPMIWLSAIVLRDKWTTRYGMSNRMLLFCWIMLPIILFSIAATKRPTYLLPAAPAFFMLTALFMRFITQNRQRQRYPRILVGLVWVALAFLPVRYSIERLKIFHQPKTTQNWCLSLKALAKQEALNGEKTVLFNEPHPIEAMFYTGFTAYSWMPDYKEVNRLKEEGWRVIEFREGYYHEH
jgi:4-amino-4-deoxy-L-arabinose transferase